MNDHPFVTLLIEALNLIHPRFASGHGLTYSIDEASSPAAARKEREQPFLRELYHQFRRLWDKALPVRLGLGHVLIQADPDAATGRQPDLLFWQLGEQGQPDRRLGAVSVVYLSNPDTLAAEMQLLERFHSVPGYPTCICVLVGRSSELTSSGPFPSGSLVRLFHDIDSRTASVLD